MPKWIFWDFDGTLGLREGYFSSSLFKVLNDKVPNHNIKLQDLSMGLRSGLPWHNPELCYESWTDPIVWWRNVENLFEKVYLNCGIESEQAKALSELAHFEYINPNGFIVFSDTIEVLKYFKERGWSNAILSNNVPELPDIINSLGLKFYIDCCISSANIGYEKPNKLFFEKALSLIGEIQDCWMIGDSFTADIKGAESMGIKSILVRSRRVEGVTHYSPDLYGVREIIECN